MTTSVYESAVLINAALDDTQIASAITRIKDFITNNGGQIREIEDWGRKRLAYTVAKSKIGYYAIFRFDAPGTIITKLDRTYSLDEQILRHLTIKLDKDALEQIEKNKSLSSTVKEEAPASEANSDERVAEVKVENEDND